MLIYMVSVVCLYCGERPRGAAGGVLVQVVVLGDTCNPRGMTEAASGCDVLVHEATYDESMRKFALDRGHSTASESLSLSLFVIFLSVCTSTSK